MVIDLNFVKFFINGNWRKLYKILFVFNLKVKVYKIDCERGLNKRYCDDEICWYMKLNID